jgi:hypothetical protein
MCTAVLLPEAAGGVKQGDASVIRFDSAQRTQRGCARQPPIGGRGAVAAGKCWEEKLRHDGLLRRFQSPLRPGADGAAPSIEKLPRKADTETTQIGTLPTPLAAAPSARYGRCARGSDTRGRVRAVVPPSAGDSPADPCGARRRCDTPRRRHDRTGSATAGVGHVDDPGTMSRACADRLAEPAVSSRLRTPGQRVEWWTL